MANSTTWSREVIFEDVIKTIKCFRIRFLISTTNKKLFCKNFETYVMQTYGSNLQGNKFGHHLNNAFGLKLIVQAYFKWEISWNDINDDNHSYLFSGQPLR